MSWRLSEVRQAWKHMCSAYPRACQLAGSGVGAPGPLIPLSFLQGTFSHALHRAWALWFGMGAGVAWRDRGASHWVDNISVLGCGCESWL